MTVLAWIGRQFLAVFASEIATAIRAMIDGVLRDRSQREIGAGRERDRAREAAEREEAAAAEAARDAAKRPLDEDDGFRRD